MLVKQMKLFESSIQFSLWNAGRLLYKPMQQDDLGFFECVENVYLLSSADTEFKKPRTHFFTVRLAELMAKRRKEVNGAKYFCNRDIVKRTDEPFQLRVKKANVHGGRGGSRTHTSLRMPVFKTGGLPLSDPSNLVILIKKTLSRNLPIPPFLKEVAHSDETEDF